MPLQLGLIGLTIVLYGTGAILFVVYYKRFRDQLAGYVAFDMICLFFGLVGTIIGGKRYDIMWYTARLLAAAGGVVVLLGLLWEYIRLYQREHAKTKDLEESISRRAQAEAEIIRQRELLRVTLASIGDAVIATDSAGRITFMNAVAEKLTGWYNKEAVGKEVTEVFHIVNEHTRKVVESPVTRVLAEGMIVGLANHTILVRRDKTEVPIDDSGAPIRDDSGRILGVVLVFRDITERKQTEKELRDSRGQLTLPCCQLTWVCGTGI